MRKGGGLGLRHQNLHRRVSESCRANGHLQKHIESFSIPFENQQNCHGPVPRSVKGVWKYVKILKFHKILILKTFVGLASSGIIINTQVMLLNVWVKFAGIFFYHFWQVWLVEMVTLEAILFYRSATKRAKWSSRKSVRGWVVIRDFLGL